MCIYIYIYIYIDDLRQVVGAALEDDDAVLLHHVQGRLKFFLICT